MSGGEIAVLGGVPGLAVVVGGVAARVRPARALKEVAAAAASS